MKIENVTSEISENDSTLWGRVSSSPVAVSILIGAILVSGSIFYSTSVLTRKLSSTSVSAAPTGAGQVAGAQQNAPTQGTGQPSGPVKVEERSDAPSIGKKNAPLVMYEFSDFQCPFCKQFFTDSFKNLKTKYIDTGKVRLVYRHFPLPFHINAQKSAEAAECANRQGKFEVYHDLLFTNGQPDGSGLDNASLKKYAQTAGLDTAKFNACLDGGDTAEIVKKDMAVGSAVGVTGTPSFVIGDELVVGALPWANFEQTIEAKLKK